MTIFETINGLYEIKHWKCQGDSEMNSVVENAIHHLQKQLEPQTSEREIGKWEKQYFMENGISRERIEAIVCSVCRVSIRSIGWHDIKWMKYCPNCGAKMEVDK